MSAVRTVSLAAYGERSTADGHTVVSSTTLVWRQDAPLEVRITVDDDPARSWVLSRDLLAEGLIRPAGEGVVRLRPVWGDGDPELVIVADGPAGVWRGRLVHAMVTRWLDLTRQIVAQGSEAVRVPVDARDVAPPLAPPVPAWRRWARTVGLGLLVGAWAGLTLLGVLSGGAG